ncbi:uncharacterized protein LOC128471031 [Spea bombifrons]|uniref:uncharacterized protein LOC128471031 n=1 Tax=Spea bombifrons TaxID=233779 RepID=UPI00234BF7AE|nr:uncharacterized protein LOC128471031 [Spea bombifrons]
MTTHSTMGLLYTISESHGESPSISPQSAGTLTPVDHDTQGKRQDSHTAIKNGTVKKGKTNLRLAQLRGQIRAQVREHSPRNQMIELVDKVTHGKGDTRAYPEESKNHKTKDGKKLCQCSSPTCLVSELEGNLHTELTALRLEMKSSMETLRTELREEIRALHKDVKVCCHHCPAKDTVLPQASEKHPEWKNVFKKVNRKEEQEAHVPVRLDGQIKAKSVPSLLPQSGPSRNQVLLRAMTTIAAKNALVSSVGKRSDSDPVLPSATKQKHKPASKSQEATGNGQCNANWNRKFNNGTVAPLPQNGVSTAKAH